MWPGTGNSGSCRSPQASAGTPNNTREPALSGEKKPQPRTVGVLLLVKEIATREGIDNSYISRMVNLTTLAPDIIAAILDDTLPAQVTLFDLASGAPLLWEEQRDLIRQYGAGALTPGD